MRIVMSWRFALKMIELVLGGARSGKSRYAEQQAIESAEKIIYIATAEAGDEEMVARINLHRQQRPQHWQTIEEPIHLGKLIKQYDHHEYYLLVDCLTLWLSNILFNKQGELQQQVFESQRDELLQVLKGFSGRIIMVSNEVGSGLVAMDKMTRLFVDEAGRLHQRIAEISDKVVLVTAGIPQRLK